jgi:hypothetical protein
MKRFDAFRGTVSLVPDHTHHHPVAHDRTASDREPRRSIETRCQWRTTARSAARALPAHIPIDQHSEQHVRVVSCPTCRTASSRPSRRRAAGVLYGGAGAELHATATAQPLPCAFPLEHHRRIRFQTP